MSTARARVWTVATAIGAGALVVLLLVGFLGSSPAACLTCHAAVQNSSADHGVHAKMDCYTCHLSNGYWSLPGQKAEEIFRMYPLALIGAKPSGVVRQIARSRCLTCHEKVLRTASMSGDIRIDHKTCAAGSCDNCHASLTHGKAVRWKTAPSMESCNACHKRTGAPNTCITCHNERAAENRRYRGTWQVTHGKNWRTTHGMGDLDSCSTCHPQNFCSKCHQIQVPHDVNFGATHGQVALGNRTACGVCHKDEKLCAACHQIAMPHPAGFIKTHTKVAKGKNDKSCLRCHGQEDCKRCHSYHVHPGGAKGLPVPWATTPEYQRPVGE